jgi:hypothetical protein
MMVETTTSREERGQAIAQCNGQVKRLEQYRYSVKSQSHNGEYIVAKVGDEWVCECLDNKYRHLICKHIYAVDFSSQLRNEVAVNQANRVIQEVNVQNCQICGSDEIVKAGLRKNQNGNIQKYLCKKCGHYFTINLV